MDENKDTIKIEVKKSAISTLLFVILHLIVITGWGFSIMYVGDHPRVVFFRVSEEPNQYYEENWGKDSSTVWPKASAEDEAK